MKCKHCGMKIRVDADGLYVHVGTGLSSCLPKYFAEPEEK